MSAFLLLYHDLGTLWYFQNKI